MKRFIPLIFSLIIGCQGGCGRGLQNANFALDRADQIDSAVVFNLTEIARVNATDLAVLRMGKGGENPKLVLGQYGNVLTDVMIQNVNHARAGTARTAARLYLDSLRPFWDLLFEDVKKAEASTTTQPGN